MRRFVIILILLGVGLSPAAAQEPFTSTQALEALWDQVHAQPTDFSAACMPLGRPAEAVEYHADQAFPLASVSKLLIFIAYAQQVDAGIIPLNEQVPVLTLTHYDIPQTNSGAHEEFMSEYPVGTQSISLWDVARLGMIQYSSNAASDYVLHRLGEVDWDALYSALKLTGTDTPEPLGVIAMLMDNHETGRTTQASVTALSVEKAQAQFDSYISDPAWREAEIAYRVAHGPAVDWEAQARVLQRYTVKGTAQDFLNVLTAIYGDGGPLSDVTKWMARSALQWHDNAYVDSMYAEYGSKLGFYAGGTLTLVAYGEPYIGTPVISAAFFRNIPRDVYNAMRRQDSIGELAHWMNLNGCAGLLDAIRGDEE